MHVECANCGAANDVESSIPPEGTTLTCTKCHTRFVAHQPSFDDGVATQDGEEGEVQRTAVGADVRPVDADTPTYDGEVSPLASPTNRKEPSNLYERIEAGLDVSPRRAKQEPEHSVRIVVSRVPVAVRVFVVVFILALGLGWVINRLRSSDPTPIPPAPVEIPSRPVVAVTSTVTRPEVATATSAKPRPASKLFVDAPGGFSYVTSDSTVRASASEKGIEVGLAREGRVVKLVENVETTEGYKLVLLTSRGPVGFLPSDHLSSKKPLSASARDLFPTCESDEKEACSMRDKGLADCVTRCGQQAPNEDARCQAACGAGLEICGRVCDGDRKKASPAKQKRPTR